VAAPLTDIHDVLAAPPGICEPPKFAQHGYSAPNSAAHTGTEKLKARANPREELDLSSWTVLATVWEGRKLSRQRNSVG